MSANIAPIVNLFEVAREDFVSEAYRAILGREVDPSGKETFEGKLGSGSIRNKRIVIMGLAGSAEARDRSPVLPLLARQAINLHRLRFLPSSRSLIVLAAAQYESQRAIEARLYLLQQEIDRDPVKIVTEKSDSNALLLEHILRSLKGLSFAFQRLEGQGRDK